MVKKEKELVESKAALSITFSLIVGLVSEWTMYFLEETQKSLTLMQNKSDQDAQSLQSYRDSIHLLENEVLPRWMKLNAAIDSIYSSFS